jgi:hypothetical protein
MANTTLPNDEKQEDKLNPGQRDYDRRFNDIAKAEEQGSFDNIVNNFDQTADSSQEDANVKNIQERESEGDSSINTIKSNYTGENNKKSKIKGTFLRRKGPLGILITILLGGGVGLGVLFSPGILIVQMKETMTEKFNTQLASMDVRSQKILAGKVGSTTGGVCLGKVTVGCKYSSMSAKQVERFKNANIDVLPAESNSIAGRTKPTSFVFEGETIDAKNFASKMRTKPAFKTAVLKAYNPKFAGFADKTWAGFAKRIGLTKKVQLTGSTKEELDESLNKTVKNGADQNLKPVNAGDRKPGTGDTDCDGGPCTYSQEEADKIRAQINEIESGATAGEKAGANAVGAVGEAAKGTFDTIGNFFKLTGAVDTACQAYGAVQTLGYAAKTVRAIQLARYAMVFFTVADAIKAGDATPEQVAYLGTILTSLALDAKGAATRGSATNSYGYNYASFGDSGPMKSNFTSQFLAGGGLTGDLISVTNTINDLSGGNAKETCKALGNPWVQAGSFLGGVALMLVPGVGQAASIAKTAIQAGVSISLGIAMAILPEMLKDVVAGNVTEGIVGEDAGDAITSGAGNLMGGVAAAGGNSPLTKSEAIAYNNLQNQTKNDYIKTQVASMSPFDISSKHTFLGSIVSSFLPYTTNISTAGSLVAGFGSIASRSVASIIPQSNALSTAQYEASLDVCDDPDYKDIGVATDPFCNVIYGLPTKYLDKDPLAVSNELIAAEEIDDTGAIIGEDYKTFVKDCIDRTEPLGSTGSDQTGDDGKKCILTDGAADNDKHVNYYLYYVDQRVETGMDGYNSTEEESSIDGDAQSLAQQILASGNVTDATYDTDDGDGPRELAQLQMVADGTATGNCASDARILKVIAGLAKNHKLVISDLGRECNGSKLSSSGSTHWASPNVAVDFDSIDGNGNPDSDIAIINEALSYVDSGQTISVGQVGSSGRGGGNLSPPSGVTVNEFSDGAGHLHLNF